MVFKSQISNVLMIIPMKFWGYYLWMDPAKLAFFWSLFWNFFNQYVFYSRDNIFNSVRKRQKENIVLISYKYWSSEH